MSLKVSVSQHLAAPIHMRYASFTQLPCLSYIKKLNKRKLRTASCSAPEKKPHCHLAFGGTITNYNEEIETPTTT